MSSLIFRSTLRAASRAAVRSAPAYRVLPMKINGFSSSAKYAKEAHLTNPADFVPAKEVLVSTVTGGTVVKDAVTVAPEEEAVEEPEVLIPLTQEAFDAMTPTLKKMTIKGKVVLVTGGARGLGNYMAKACIEAGASALAIFDANQENGDLAMKEFNELIGDAVPISFYKVDVRDGDAVATAVATLVEDYGAPDILINSAGIADSNIPAESYTHSMFRRLIDINLTGTFMMAQAIGKEMILAGKPGSMVFIASMSGSIVNYPQEQSCYNASKAGVVQFGKSLAAEWAKYGIRVNMISPGYMDTALNNVPALDAQKAIWKTRTPQDRLGAVDDLNGLAVFLASDASGYMTGSNVIIDGGYTLW